MFSPHLGPKQTAAFYFGVGYTVAHQIIHKIRQILAGRCRVSFGNGRSKLVGIRRGRGLSSPGDFRWAFRIIIDPIKTDVEKFQTLRYSTSPGRFQGLHAKRSARSTCAASVRVITAIFSDFHFQARACKLACTNSAYANSLQAPWPCTTSNPHTWSKQHKLN